MRTSASEQKFPQCMQMKQLEIGSCSQVEQPGTEPESGGADLSTLLHCQEFQQEPDLSYPRG